MADDVLRFVPVRYNGELERPLPAELFLDVPLFLPVVEFGLAFADRSIGQHRHFGKRGS